MGHIKQFNDIDSIEINNLGIQLQNLELTQLPDETMKPRRNLDLYFERVHSKDAGSSDLFLSFYHSHIDRIAPTWFFNMSP